MTPTPSTMLEGSRPASGGTPPSAPRCPVPPPRSLRLATRAAHATPRKSRPSHGQFRFLSVDQSALSSHRISAISPSISQRRRYDPGRKCCTSSISSSLRSRSAAVCAAAAGRKTGLRFVITHSNVAAAAFGAILKIRKRAKVVNAKDDRRERKRLRTAHASPQESGRGARRSGT